MKKIIYVNLINIISNLLIILNKINIFFFAKHDFLPKISDKIEKFNNKLFLGARIFYF